GHDADRPVALGQPGAVVAENHRYVGELGRLDIERAIDIDLARRVVDVIVAADDQVDAHVEIVDDYGKVVGRRTIGAHDHQIVELAVGHLDGPAHAIAKQDRSGKR